MPPYLPNLKKNVPHKTNWSQISCWSSFKHIGKANQIKRTTKRSQKKKKTKEVESYMDRSLFKNKWKKKPTENQQQNTHNVAYFIIPGFPYEKASRESNNKNKQYRPIHFKVVYILIFFYEKRPLVRYEYVCLSWNTCTVSLHART